MPVKRHRIIRPKLGLLLLAALGLALVAGLSPASADTVAASVKGLTATGQPGVPRECLKHKEVGYICGHTRILLVKYKTNGCHVQRNYPLNPGSGTKSWDLPDGTVVKWRYNVNSSVAAVSLTTDAFPHWVFVTNSGCVGRTTGQTGCYWKLERNARNGRTHWVRHSTPDIPAHQAMPKRLHEGRSQHPNNNYWNHVDWEPQGPAIPAAKRKMSHSATLRDQPNEFVIGNVLRGWTVQPVNEHRLGYTKVYVPSLERWGWIQLG